MDYNATLLINNALNDLDPIYSTAICELNQYLEYNRLKPFIPYELTELFYKLHYVNNSDFNKEVKRRRSISQKRVRIKKHIKKLIEKDCLFITLTFNNDYVDMPDRRRKIMRYLNSLECNYIGNVDYGKLNGRVHYHVLIQKERIDPKSYKYGNIDFIKVNSMSPNALSTYICKLTNHAVKDTTQNSERILSNRKKY